MAWRQRAATDNDKAISIDIRVIPYRSANVGKSECVNIRDEMGALLASDDAVFWFYNAKNRAILLREIINLSHAQAK